MAGKSYPAVKKQRCLSAIRLRIKKKHSIQKSMRLVSDLEGVPVKTLEWWFYTWRQQQKVEAAIRPSEEKPDSSGGLQCLSEPTPQDPRPASLLTDGAELRCSRCSSKQITQQGKEEYYCEICQRSLQFEGWPTEKTSEFPLYGKDTWMA